MQLTKDQLTLIYYCLEDCANNPDWKHLDREIWDIVSKIEPNTHRIKE